MKNTIILMNLEKPIDIFCDYGYNKKADLITAICANSSAG